MWRDLEYCGFGKTMSMCGQRTFFKYSNFIRVVFGIPGAQKQNPTELDTIAIQKQYFTQFFFFFCSRFPQMS